MSNWIVVALDRDNNWVDVAADLESPKTRIWLPSELIMLVEVGQWADYVSQLKATYEELLKEGAKLSWEFSSEPPQS